MTASAQSRAHGALLGLAIGDALGMPTQYLPRELIADRYGVLDDFYSGPEDNAISRGLPAGRVTDDTDQALILGRLLVEGRGHVEPDVFAERLLAWEGRMIEAGSADLLGPSTRKALVLAAEGVPTSLTGRTGATNGAAMRVAPVGIAFAHDPIDALIEAVVQSGHVTHNTTIGIAGAAAVAAAVSAGIAGAKLKEALGVAVDAARLGAKHGFYYAGADVATRISWAIDLVKGRSTQDALDLIYRLVGTGVATQEAVPAAIAICSVAPDDPWLVCRLAASLGGDCDTVAAIAGAIVGACNGSEGFPRRAVEALHVANPELALEELANRLLLLRTAAANLEHAQPDGGQSS